LSSAQRTEPALLQPDPEWTAVPPHAADEHFRA
jgi:hypothetical protein